MAVTVGAYEAKTHFSDLLDRAARGEIIMVSRHGVPVAQFGPISAPTARQASLAVEAIKKMRAGITLGGLSLTELKNEGRP